MEEERPLLVVIELLDNGGLNDDDWLGLLLLEEEDEEAMEARLDRFNGAMSIALLLLFERLKWEWGLLFDVEVDEGDDDEEDEEVDVACCCNVLDVLEGTLKLDDDDEVVVAALERAERGERGGENRGIESRWVTWW